MHTQVVLVPFSWASLEEKYVHGWGQAYPMTRSVPGNTFIPEKQLIPYSLSYNSSGCWQSYEQECVLSWLLGKHGGL